MAGLPKGLLKSLIKEGYDPPEAMKEAWRIVEVQKKRYAARMSHGGEYPLGYKGRNNPFKKLKWSMFAGGTSAPEGKYGYSVNTDLGEYHISVTPRGRYQVNFADTQSIVGRGLWNDLGTFSSPQLAKQAAYKHYKELGGKNPRRKKRRNPVISGTFAGLVDNPIIMSSKSQAQFFVNVLNEKLSVYPYTHIYISALGGESRVSILITISLDPKSEWPNGILENSRYAKFHLGYDGKLEMITGSQVGKMRKVTVKNISDASIKIFRFLGYPQKNPSRQKTRKNPIAFYNPRGGTLIYGRVLELRAVKTSGRYKGERYRHQFGPHVEAIGLSNGSVLLKSNNGARLWKSI